MASVCLHTQFVWERYIICLTAHTECMRAVCHIFDCMHRMYDSGMSSVWLHTQYLLEWYGICLTAHTGWMRALHHLFDCTHRIYDILKSSLINRDVAINLLCAPFEIDFYPSNSSIHWFSLGNYCLQYSQYSLYYLFDCLYE